MAQSSDEIIKREILQEFGTKFNGFTLRVFPQSSNDDQKAFSDGGLTFGIIGVYYLKKGVHKIQEDLFGMAYFVSKTEKGKYLIIDNLDELKELLLACSD